MKDLYEIARSTAEHLTADGWVLDREYRSGDILPRFSRGTRETLCDPEDFFVSLNAFNDEQARWTEEDCRNLGKEVVGVLFRRGVAAGILSHAESQKERPMTDEQVDAWLEDTIRRNYDEIVRLAKERSQNAQKGDGNG